MADFQLDPKDFKTGNFLVDQAVSAAVKAANKADLNKNKVPDIQELALVGAKLLPALVALNSAIDFEALAKQLASNPAVKNHALLSEALIQLGALAEQLGALLPHHE